MEHPAWEDSVACPGLGALHMDDVQESLGALVARYVLGTCQVLVLDLTLGYTCAGNAGHFPGTVVSGAMRCCRRSVACRQKEITESGSAPTKISSLLAMPSSPLNVCS